MPDLTARIANLLDPLAEFYSAEGRTLPRVETMPPDDLPQPARSLLVHDRDMTSTLEAFYADTLHLRVLNMHQHGHALNRQVVLETDRDDRAVEFGAIQIHLDRFSHEARDDIIACHRPLGTIIAAHAIAYRSQPSAFFAIEPDVMINSALGLPLLGDQTPILYGRHNTLVDREGGILAEVVEILAPLSAEPGPAHS